MNGGFRRISRRTLHRSRVFTLDAERWRASDGSVFSRDTIVHPGAVAILPRTRRGTYLFIRQFRAAARGWLLEIPAGTLEKGETPLACAKRELIEEVGFAAKKWRKLGAIYTAPGFCTEVIHIYEAWDLKEAKAEQDEDEHIRVKELTLAQVKAAVKSGKIRDGKSVSAVHLAGV